MRALFLLGTVVGVGLLPACQSQPTAATTAPPTITVPPSAVPMLPAFQTEKFNLSANPGCAEGYPARIQEGRFINSAGGGFPVPSGHFLTTAWTGTPIGWAVGDPLQAVPDSLELRWFSYTENKFYEGHFLLPQEKIYHLLKQGFWNKYTKANAAKLVRLTREAEPYFWG